MAYTEPATVTTGDLATAALHNTQIVASIKALYAGELSVASQAAGDLLYATSATQWTRTPGKILVPTVVTLTDGVTPALDASLGTIFRLAAQGDRTIAVPSNPTAGQKLVIQHYADGGARTLALNTGAGGFRFGTDVSALTATTSGKTDYIGCIYNGTNSFWDVVAVSKGH